MPPRQSRKMEPISVHASDSDDSGEQSSQGNKYNPVKLAQGIVTKFKNTREESRNAIEVEHKQQVNETAAKIDALFEARKKRVTKSRKELFARLVAMNKRRQAIESQILASMRTIEIHSGNISSELNAMFSGRIEEVESNNVNT